MVVVVAAAATWVAVEAAAHAWEVEGAVHVLPWEAVVAGEDHRCLGLRWVVAVGILAEEHRR